MSVEVAPPELARLIDVAERPRIGNWSLRAALTRYGQPQPQRASDLIEVLRRIDVALRPQMPAFERHGQALWTALAEGGPTPDSELAPVVELLRVISEVDDVGDALANWAHDRSAPRPDEDTERVVVDAMGRLDALGVPREEGRPPQRSRGSAKRASDRGGRAT